MNAWQLTVHLGKEMLLIVDGALNGLGLTLAAIFMALVTGKPQDPAYSDEMLSSHCWRAAVRGRKLAVFFLPIVDALFIWQKPDVFEKDGTPIKSPCARAYVKEKERRYLPPEYR